MVEGKSELEAYRKEQEEILNNTHEKNYELMDFTLKALLESINKAIKTYENELDVTIKNIEKEYRKNESKIINEIIEKLGFDFFD